MEEEEEFDRVSEEEEEVGIGERVQPKIASKIEVVDT